ncbi:MAG: glycosyltransferase family 9 protein [Bacteroidota bacterium]
MAREQFFFIGHNALGDTLCTTPVVRTYRQAHPEAVFLYICQDIEYCRVLEANPDIDLVIYNQKMLLSGLADYSSAWVESLPLDYKGYPEFIHFDMKRMADLPNVFEDHISKGFARLLGVETDTVKPILEIGAREERKAAIYTSRPYVVLGMHSVTNTAYQREGVGIKEWGRYNWLKLAETLAKEWGYEVILVGAESEPQLEVDYVKCLHGLPILTVAALLKNAACVITLESGLGHLAAAVDAPMVMLYTDILHIGWANPSEASRCEVLYKDLRTLPLEEVLEAVNRVTKMVK